MPISYNSLLDNPHLLASHVITNREESQKYDNRLDLRLDFSSTESSQTHPHVLFSPVHYEPGYAYPLLVWLHNSGADERQVMQVMPSVSIRNYVAVAPQGIANDDEDISIKPISLDVGTIIREGLRHKSSYDWSYDAISEIETRVFDCISVAKKRCNISGDRIFIAGTGSGGTMAFRLAFLYPECFRGAASLGGGLPIGQRFLHRWTFARTLSVFLSVDRKSSTFTPSDACKALELLHTAGMSVKVREYECGCELSKPMLQELNRWMMEHICQ